MNCNKAITESVPVSKEGGLFESDTYMTKPRDFSAMRKLLTWNGLVFYWKLYRIVARGARMARTDAYTRQGWFDLSLDILRLIESQGGKLVVTGLDNVRKTDGPVVYVGNHMSMLETIVLPCLLLKQSDICITLKQQLFDVPIFGTLITGFRTISVTRDKPMEDYKTIIRSGSAALKEGYSVLIFPQSTRTVNFNPEEFNTVGVKLAKKAGVPVVPVALKTDFWQAGKIVKDVGPLARDKNVHFAFADPIAIDSRTGKEENAVIIEFIQKNLDEWRA